MPTGALAEFFVKIGAKINNSEFKQAESQANKLAGTLRKIFAAVGVGLSLKAMNQMAEEYQNINDSISYQTRGLEDAQNAQQRILELSEGIRQTYKETANEVNGLIKEKTFDSFGEAVRYTELLHKHLLGSEMSIEQMNTAQSTLNAALKKGTLDKKTYEQLEKDAGDTLELIAKGLGKTKEQLVGTKFTAKEVAKAFEAVSDEIDERYAKAGLKISDAIKIIKDQWGVFFAQLWEDSGIGTAIGNEMINTSKDLLAIAKELLPILTKIVRDGLQKFRQGINWLKDLARQFGGVERAANIIFSLLQMMGAWFAAGHIAKAISTVIGMLQNPAIMAFVGLFMFIQDFVYFMLGQGSLIGSLLEDAGINSNEVRNSISELGENIVKKIQEIGAELEKIFGSEDFKELLHETGKLLAELATGAVIVTLATIYAALELIRITVEAIAKAWAFLNDNEEFLDNLEKANTEASVYKTDSPEGFTFTDEEQVAHSKEYLRAFVGAITGKEQPVEVVEPGGTSSYSKGLSNNAPNMVSVDDLNKMLNSKLSSPAVSATTASAATSSSNQTKIDSEYTNSPTVSNVFNGFNETRAVELIKSEIGRLNIENNALMTRQMQTLIAGASNS